VRAGQVLRKLRGAALLVVAVFVFNFFLFRVVDRDPLARFRRSKLSLQQRTDLIERFGLAGNKWEQFTKYVSTSLRGDFGRSFESRQPVSTEIWQRLPNTLWLVGISTVLTVALGLWIGSRAGWRRGSQFDKISTSATMVLYATPEFFLGMLMLSYLATRAGWFPTGGVRDIVGNETGVAAVVDRLRHLALPIATLTLGYLGSYSLIMRTAMLDTAGEDYLVTARAKGLRDHDVMRRHAVPNALLPSVSQIAIGFGFVIGGAITTETVFSYPGLGLLTFESIEKKDLPMLQALFLFSTIAVVLFNAAADLTLGLLDPRVREE
jgi:peptide/nickel transport system permease protein